jgi:hypothetical protein
VVPDDPFRVLVAGRCAFRTEDLLAVAGLVDRLRAGGADQNIDLVGEIVP